LQDGLGYVDLFGLHGINTEQKIKWALGCMPILREYQAAGKIRHIGFSTHAQTDILIQAIEELDVDYVNLHYHFIGSYTTLDNLPAIEAAREKDMGVFIISPSDKGGMLYKPSTQFAECCAPISPIGFNNLWLLGHEGIHTLVVGAEKPSDFDEHMRNVALYDRRSELVPPIESRLMDLAHSTLGSDWVGDCRRFHEIVGTKGIPNMFDNQYGIAVGQILWLYNLHKVHKSSPHILYYNTVLSSATHNPTDHPPLMIAFSLSFKLSGVGHDGLRQENLPEFPEQQGTEIFFQASR